jgi:glycyl-tRNA synthetase alpha chain
VILKPSPDDVQDIFIDSLRALGISLESNDLRFEEDNWESPTLGAWGIGWQVLLNGLEITQFTYFQQAGGQELFPISAEITYGLERIAAFMTGKDSVYDLAWSAEHRYGDVRKREEFEFSRYSFELSDKELLFQLFELYEKEALRCLAEECILPAYDYCLKCSHTFNLLDSRGAISVTERVGIINRVRNLAVSIAECYLKADDE